MHTRTHTRVHSCATLLSPPHHHACQPQLLLPLSTRFPVVAGYGYCAALTLLAPPHLTHLLPSCLPPITRYLGDNIMSGISKLVLTDSNGIAGGHSVRTVLHKVVVLLKFWLHIQDPPLVLHGRGAPARVQAVPAAAPAAGRGRGRGDKVVVCAVLASSEVADETPEL